MDVTTMMDLVVAKLNELGAQDKELSLWYSWNDGTWKWAVVQQVSVNCLV